MLLVGLTGGMGAGKSVVAGLLASRGAFVVDIDGAARSVVEPGSAALHELADRFGAAVVGPDGRLDRAELARRAFADAAGRRVLEAITHPLIRVETDRLVAAAPADAIVVCDVPLLVEALATPEGRRYDAVVVVEAPIEQRLDRLEARGVERTDAARRIAAQATDDERRAVSDWVIDNSGDQAALEAEVDRVWAELARRHRGSPS